MVLNVKFYTKNEREMISCGTEGLIKVWKYDEVTGGTCVATLEEYDDKVVGCCVLRDRQHIVTGGADGRLILWKDTTEDKKEEEKEKSQERAVE